MSIRWRVAFITVLSCAALCSVTSAALAHGVMRIPASRAIGTPNEDYQFCFGTAGCECGEFPDPGVVTAVYDEGETIEVTIEVTQTHDSLPVFRFQLCPPDQLSPECFVDGEFASVDFDHTLGTRSYEIDLPDGVVCDPCVLRWKWDYGFLSCADVRIVATGVDVGSERDWTALKASYR